MKVLDTEKEIGKCIVCGAVGGVIVEIENGEMEEICPDCLVKASDKMNKKINK